jgi:hypothetical protein
LYLLSTLYKQTNEFQQAHESLHLAIWFLVKVLRDESSQLFHVVFKAYSDFNE